MTTVDSLDESGPVGQTPGGGGARKAKLLNLLFLVGSFGAGQGAIFAVQTALVAHGRVDLLASFGTCFSFAILFVLLIDFGSQTTIARETAIARARPDGRNTASAAYWHATSVRLLLGLVTLAVAASYAFNAANPFERSYILYALPVAVIWPFNATGILDGLRMSGLAGIVGSAPYVASAAALVLATQLDPAQGGAILGIALSVGYAASVAAQLIALVVLGQAPVRVRPTFAGVRKAAIEGGSVFLTMAPGQFYFRYQLLLAALFLGTHGTAMFVYAKQIVTAFAQVIAFMRRIEFPDLVTRLGRAQPGDLLREAWSAQLVGTLVGMAGTIMMLCGGLLVLRLSSDAIADAAFSAALMSPTVVAAAVTMGATQALQAIGRYHVVATAMLAATVLAALANATVAVAPLLCVFVAADLIVYTIGAVTCALALRSAQKAVT